jgi:hypothetical protein
MTRRVITAAVTASWPTGQVPTGINNPCYAASVKWLPGTAMEIAAGSALETAIGTGNMRNAVDGDVVTPKNGATSN